MTKDAVKKLYVDRFLPSSDCVGQHLLADFRNVENMDDLDYIKKTIEESARIAGATILHSYYHSFGSGMGVSGVTVLSESHISIHTWPEYNSASLDIFMCGECNPEVALDYLVETYKPEAVEKHSQKRGVQNFLKGLSS